MMNMKLFVFSLHYFTTFLTFVVSSDSSEEAPLVAVYAIRGTSARLPCNITAINEDPVILVLWYRNGIKTPIYSIDFRSSAISDGAIWTSKKVFGDRAHFELSGPSSALAIQNPRYEDQGLYRCRVDFQSTPTHNGRVQLHVIDPPRALHVYTAGGSVVERGISVQEGQPLLLVCRAVGGEPSPNITWWMNNEMLTGEISSATSNATTSVTNTLKIPSIGKSHLNSENMSCRASNNPQVPPLEKSIRLFKFEGGLKVKIASTLHTLKGGKEYTVQCNAGGIQPPPSITWRLRGRVITDKVQTEVVSANETRSSLHLLAGPGDDQTELQCVAKNPSLPHIVGQDSRNLTVLYVPQVSVKISGGSNSTFFKHSSDHGGGVAYKQGDSATLTCNVKANPPSYNVTFLLNGRHLHREKVMKIDKTITIINLTHEDAGLYTCVASNPEGDGQSNAVNLHINYAPMCAWFGTREVLALEGEEVQLLCEVRSSPSVVTFQWWKISLSNVEKASRTKIEHEKINELSSVSKVLALNLSSEEAFECWSSNAVGTIEQPCTFVIKMIEPPSAVIGCSISDVTTDSATVMCSPGQSGALTEFFHIEVREKENSQITYNNSAMEPKFMITTLTPGRDYVVLIYAVHDKGIGPKVALMLKTRQPKAEQVAPELIEVKGENPPGEGLSSSASGTASHESSFPFALISGIAAGTLVAVVLVIIVALRCQRRFRRRRALLDSAKETESTEYKQTSKESLIDLQGTTEYHAGSRRTSSDPNLPSSGALIVKRHSRDASSSPSTHNLASPAQESTTNSCNSPKLTRRPSRKHGTSKGSSEPPGSAPKGVSRSSPQTPAGFTGEKTLVKAQINTSPLEVLLHSQTPTLPNPYHSLPHLYYPIQSQVVLPPEESLHLSSFSLSQSSHPLPHIYVSPVQRGASYNSAMPHQLDPLKISSVQILPAVPLHDPNSDVIRPPSLFAQDDLIIVPEIGYQSTATPLETVIEEPRSLKQVKEIV